MVDPRREAKAAIVSSRDTDSQFETAITASTELRGKLAQHSHDQAMADKELGKFGQFFGGKSMVPLALAVLTTLLAIMIYVGLLFACVFLDKDRAALLSQYPDKVLAVATLALGFVFGKSSNG